MTNPAAAERDLIAQGASPAQARAAVQGINPRHGQPSMWQDIASMAQPAMDFTPMGQAINWMSPHIDPYGPMARLMGIHAPPLARPTRRRR
jgi:hypothetical protein